MPFMFLPILLTPLYLLFTPIIIAVERIFGLDIFPADIWAVYQQSWQDLLQIFRDAF